MATQLQIRRGTTSQMNAFTGAEGELAVNTTTDTVHVHDGSTAGGHALAKADGSNIGTYAGSFTTIAASGTITGDVTGDLTGSVLTAAQTNITSLGTLSALTVSGALTVDTNTLVVDATNNRMGVGTSSPASLIDATGAPLATSGSIVRVRNTSATSSNTSFGGVLFTSSPGTDFSIGKSNVNAATSLSFRNGNTGASLMELTSAGDLLVGKSAIDFATVGTEIMDHGEIQVTRAGVPMYLRRNGSDGDILSLYRDGTTVGSIGTNSGYMVIGSPVGTDAHLLIGNDLIHPATSSGGVKDAAIDLGGSSNRFKDLYLSGGAYLGGTGAGNKLDDYEEGTWTPVIKAIGTGGNNATYNVGSSGYTKVGRSVTVHTFISSININAITAGTYITLQGLPFPSTNYADFTIAYKGGSWATAGNIIGGYVQTGTSYAYFMRADGVEAQQDSTDVTMTKAMISITYQAA